MNDTNLGQVPGALSEVLSPRRLGPDLDPRVALQEDWKGILLGYLAGSSDGDDAAALLFLPFDEESLFDVDRVGADRRAADDLSSGEDVAGVPDFHEAAEPRRRGERTGLAVRGGTRSGSGGGRGVGRDLGPLGVHGEGGVARDDRRVGGRGGGRHVLKSKL